MDKLNVVQKVGALLVSTKLTSNLQFTMKQGAFHCHASKETLIRRDNDNCFDRLCTVGDVIDPYRGHDNDDDHEGEHEQGRESR